MGAVGITTTVAVLAEDFITHKEQLASMDEQDPAYTEQVDEQN